MIHVQFFADENSITFLVTEIRQGGQFEVKAKLKPRGDRSQERKMWNPFSIFFNMVMWYFSANKKTVHFTYSLSRRMKQNPR